jgi:toluene monooxygenase system protein A
MTEPVLPREEWLDLARKLDWEFSYVREQDVYPEAVSGGPWLPHAAWAGWDEPYRTSYAEYVEAQCEKDAAVYAVQGALGRQVDAEALDRAWVNGVKVHAATLPLAEFAAVVGNLRAARFGRDSAWRTMATYGALDECRHTQIPLALMHERVRWDEQFDWTHRFYHSNNWVAIAARHLFDELLLCANPIEFAIATNFVFETGFTNLQFVGLASLAHAVGDRLFEKMVTSIQTDEARHSQIGPAVLAIVVRHDRARAQYLVDKWFWRNFLLFAVVTGFTMDYLTPVERRGPSFKEFVQEWVVDQYLSALAQFGLERPWYWESFLQALDHYHHMVYASAYSYRATVWFDLVMPGPAERRWLKQKYPASWDALDPVWETLAKRWAACDPGVDWGVHGSAIIGFCNLCQLVLCGGTPAANTAVTLSHAGRRHIFCSAPCRWIFEQEPGRYAAHDDLVKRVLAGQAPANLAQMLTGYFGLRPETWGRDAWRGDYEWLEREPRSGVRR